MVPPVRFAAAAVLAFVGALLAPALYYLGRAAPFPVSAVGLLLVALGPGLLCRSWSAAVASALVGSLAAFLVWLTLIFVPPLDGLVAVVSSATLLDPLLSYIVLFSGVSLVAGLVGGLSAPRAEEAVPVSFEAETGVEKRETGGVEVEARPREVEAAVQIPGEIVYVKCPHCGEPIPIEAIYCPHCGRRIKPE
jgi:hypothetical protein